MGEMNEILAAKDDETAIAPLDGEITDTLTRALAEVREVGWAAAVEEMTVGEASVALPIRGHGGLVVGAIGISGAVERVCDQRLCPVPSPKPTSPPSIATSARAPRRLFEALGLTSESSRMLPLVGWCRSRTMASTSVSSSSTFRDSPGPAKHLECSTSRRCTSLLL